MKMKLDVLVIVYVCIFICTIELNCMAQEQYSIENFMNAKVACVEEYISNDINIAEQSLLKFQKIIIHYKNKNFKGIKYDYNLGLVYMRLYLLTMTANDGWIL